MIMVDNEFIIRFTHGWIENYLLLFGYLATQDLSAFQHDCSFIDAYGTSNQSQAVMQS